MKLLSLFGVLFPSWRFFTHADAVPRLWVRAAGDPPGEWKLCLRDHPRRRLFLNAQENEFLARYSLLARFTDELGEGRFGALPLVENLARFEARRLKVPRAFQFKLGVADGDLYISDPLRGET